MLKELLKQLQLMLKKLLMKHQGENKLNNNFDNGNKDSVTVKAVNELNKTILICKVFIFNICIH